MIEESGIEHQVEDTDEVVEKFKEFPNVAEPEDFLPGAQAVGPRGSRSWSSSRWP